MREVSPGDVVFSFVDTFIAAIGVARSYCWESPKPTEFGTTGQYWEDIGWKVRVHFTPIVRRVRPKDHIEVLRPLFPARYGPLQANGDGKQGLYLTEITPPFAEVLIGLIGAQARSLIGSISVGAPMHTNDDLDWWEHLIEGRIEKDTSISPTDREAIIRARRGQGIFKQRVMENEQRCRVTHVTNPVHLIASHCKPWRDSDNAERLNGENGLLLTPTIDRLFDRGFIGFEGDGKLILSPVADRSALERMGLDTTGTFNAGPFTAGQCEFLGFHREKVLLKAAR